ncbi:hypothetical protein M513_08986 [Trichuris suis]|uniref:Uncharacterized protein n=1 Tax=Trichuris suis TaxID=68888 RepID=A0A085LYV1_9BILA|nr:hypothetical protein M513_08986 [Trichuris suis]
MISTFQLVTSIWTRFDQPSYRCLHVRKVEKSDTYRDLQEDANRSYVTDDKRTMAGGKPVLELLAGSSCVIIATKTKAEKLSDKFTQRCHVTGRDTHPY